MIDLQEQQYFKQTLEKLREAYQQRTDNIDEHDKSFKDLQQYMVDYNSELDKFEVYDYQQTLHMIDKKGFAKVIEREQIKKLIESPYFGRLQFVYEGDDFDEAENFYVGRFGFSDEDGNSIIYDWRAPVCNMYYEFELGEAYYEVQDCRFHGQIIGKRQFKIENSQILYSVDSSLTIQDVELQKTLNQYANEKMKTIITSIQREQNKIVRNESAYNVIIQGVAGSGKTAVALHRIAYYLYKYRDTLQANRVFILSPNKVFGDYISSVLPELGEQPIRSFTLDELTLNLLPKSIIYRPFEQETTGILNDPDGKLAKRAALKGNYQFVKTLQHFLQQLNSILLKHGDITISETVFSAEYLQGRFQQYQKEPVQTRLQLLTDDIILVLKSKRNGEGKIPSKNEILKRLQKRLQYNSAFDIYKAFMEQLGDNAFVSTKKSFEFNDVYPYLYVQLYFEGIKTYELVQHFVIDEMQDYTPIQYAVLAKVFDCKRTIIGDFSQALLPYETISREAFNAILPNNEMVELTTTYRSSYEIAMYAKKFLFEGEIHPIERHAEPPREWLYDRAEHMIQLIRDAISNDVNTTAVICKTAEDLTYIQKELQDVLFTILNGDTQKFEAGVILTTIQYAKGLEFDAVIVPFVNATNYSSTFDSGLLYIATTRAMHQLTMLIDAQNPSSLL